MKFSRFYNFKKEYMRKYGMLKIQFVELDFSNLIFQNSSTDQQGVCMYDLVKQLTINSLSLHKSLNFIATTYIRESKVGEDHYDLLTH